MLLHSSSLHIAVSPLTCVALAQEISSAYSWFVVAVTVFLHFIMLQKVVVLIGGVTMPIFAITGLADHKE